MGRGERRKPSIEVSHPVCTAVSPTSLPHSATFFMSGNSRAKADVLTVGKTFWASRSLPGLQQQENYEVLMPSFRRANPPTCSCCLSPRKCQLILSPTSKIKAGGGEELDSEIKTVSKGYGTNIQLTGTTHSPLPPCTLPHGGVPNSSIHHHRILMGEMELEPGLWKTGLGARSEPGGDMVPWTAQDTVQSLAATWTAPLETSISLLM